MYTPQTPRHKSTSNHLIATITLSTLISLTVLTGCTSSNLSTKSITIDDTRLQIEIATTPEEHRQGLMDRKSMPDDHGMLFVFEHSAPRNFWMKNTHIPLDIIFLSTDTNENNADNQATILNIASATPCTVDPCTIYSSTAPAKYVLELNQGKAKELQIKAGDSIALPQ